MLKNQIDKEKYSIPRHIAVVCDGNGRWARKKGLPRTLGHRAGTKPIENTIKECFELGVEVLTFYVFSSENWNRSNEEVAFLMKLFVEFFAKLRNEVGENINVRHIGSKNNLSKELLNEIKKTEKASENNSGLVLNIALNYGGRLEIVDAMQGMMQDINEGTLNADKIDEALISNYMYTAGLPDVDLIIRTSGEKRISNFLLWQSAEARLWFTNDFWPDFNHNHLIDAIKYYNKITIPSLH
ncbi:polyprenyl diphosphate synthase [Clostridium folliculivorans]|uniref:Isoprenyl transferase n=1 Tax=Clostridium folliculivorans TaxID=2886038 RepID=A0A9W5Y158_9CLOT|nr:polyprenyl diphosphate synthase [Clostridium folliculivorans]GKU24577.1 isoprenyl transferase [Clostridium folliculivorans]GKU30675.1 isoprenyl transferase [Clostridium folliculivorans]